MREFISKVQTQFTDNLPFIIYRKPNEDDLISVFQKNDNLYTVNDFSENGIVFCSFDNLQKIIIPSQYSETKIFRNDFEVRELEPKSFENDSRVASDFQELISKGIADINNQEFQKVVLSRETIVDIDEIDIISIISKLVTRYKSAFRYCFYHPKVGLWFGATPEQLVKCENNDFTTVSLAGTQQYQNSLDVIWNEKETNEQKIVTDFIAKNLKKHSNNISVSEPFTVQAGNLVHLKSIISGKFSSDFDLNKCVKILHPTPAICGMPRESAKKFILENENYNREFYSGFLGELNINNKTDLFVNLRCMKIDNQKVHIYAGCGITKDSNPEKEFQESVIKSMTMQTLL